MSQRALCLAVRDRLQSVYTWNDYQCDVTPGGEPIASAGELFVSVHEGGYSNQARDALDEIHDVNITITKRVGFSPHDRSAEEAVHKATVGLDIWAESIKATIHSDPSSYAIVSAANTYISSNAVPGATVYGFSEPLFFRRASPPQQRGADWFHSDVRGVAGLSLTLTFGGARRLHAIANQS